MSISEETQPEQVQVDEAKARIADAFKKSMERTLAAEGVFAELDPVFDRVDHVVQALTESPEVDAGILAGWGLQDEEKFQIFADRLRQLKGSDAS